MENMDFNIKSFVKTLGIFIVLYITFVGYSNYSLISSEAKLIESLKKENNFIKIKSNIDSKKLKEITDKNPIKLIYDPNYMWLSAIKNYKNNILIFIEFNPFSEKCELTARVGGLFGLLDYLSFNSTPLTINYKFYTINENVCNSIYGYQKL